MGTGLTGTLAERRNPWQLLLRTGHRFDQIFYRDVTSAAANNNGQLVFSQNRHDGRRRLRRGDFQKHGIRHGNSTRGVESGFGGAKPRRLESLDHHDDGKLEKLFGLRI